jgi:FkbM family methyltransferase
MGIVKRWVALSLGPLRAVLITWALKGPRSSLKFWVIRRVVIPNLREKRLDFSAVLDDGTVFAGNTRDLLPRTVYLFRTWEPALTRLLRSRLRPGDVFIDVGANLGWFTIVAGRLVGDHGRVFAIEPAPLVRPGLLRNIEANGLSNVRLVLEAASRSPGEVRVVPGPPEHTGVSGVVPGPGIRCDTLPGLVGESAWRAARLIKIDVEGSVYDVVEGMKEHLGELRPEAEVVVEFGGYAADRSAVAALVSAFAAAGFHPYRLAEMHDVKNYSAEAREAGHSRAERVYDIPTRPGDFVFARVDEPELSY